MPSINKIRIIFPYEFKRWTNASKTAQSINEAFGENLVSRATAKRWFKKLKEGDESLENEERGRPDLVVENEEQKRVVEANPRQTVREISGALKVSKSSVSRHFQQIEKTKKIDQWILHELTEKQKMCRLETCSSLLFRNKNDSFFGHEHPKQFPKPQLTAKKVLVTVWWSCEGLLYYKFLKYGETINFELYCQLLDKVYQKLFQKRPFLVNRKGPIFLHDNARPHISKITLQKLSELKYETLSHPPYSPDLAPTDFYFFKQLDQFLKEKVFKNEEAIKSAFEDFIDSRDGSFYSNGINKTSLVPVLAHTLTFIKLMIVKSEGEDLEEIDLPLAPVPSSRPKMKDE
uniref:Histone-lysine N-methyltransferase SETMAR (inferred by orthology to a human protein) n=1 Tax=Strongyloides venezuelensis TaxID=75913 RepID=A0A0K0FGH8_STRVS